MVITIINTVNSAVDNKSEVKLLWSTILFADRINWASPSSYIILYRYKINEVPERYRINAYESFLKVWNMKLTPEKMEEDYQTYLKIKKKKRKTIVDLKDIKEWNRFMKSLEDILMKYISSGEENLGITELSPFMNKAGKGIISLYFIEAFTQEFGIQDTEIEAVLTTLNNKFEIHAFSDLIEEHLHYKSFNDNISKDYFSKNEKAALREKFVELVAPESLVNSQVAIIRSELNEKFKDVMENIKELNKNFKEMKPSVKETSEIKKRFGEMIKPHLIKIQEAVDNNIYMNQLKNKEENPKYYKLFLALTTMKNIVGLYEKLNVISKSSAVYCREELKKSGLQNALKFIIYLKEEGE